MGKRLYTLDETFFEVINNEYKAYWLGFLYADGYVSKRKAGQDVFGIKCSINLLEHLTQFNNSIGSNKPIGEYTSGSGYNKGKNFIQLIIISSKMVNDLEKLGCVSNKSLILKFPTKEQVPENLNSHFLRGYFDGDGSVFMSEGTNGKTDVKYPRINVQLCGTFEFLDVVRSMFNLENCIYKEKRKESNTWKFTLAGNKRCLEFYNFIYNDSHIKLLYKYNIFEENIKKDVQRL